MPFFGSREDQTVRHPVEGTGGVTLNLRTILASPKGFLSGCFSGGLVSWSQSFRNVLLGQSVLASLLTLFLKAFKFSTFGNTVN